MRRNQTTMIDDEESRPPVTRPAVFVQLPTSRSIKPNLVKSNSQTSDRKTVSLMAPTLSVGGDGRKDDSKNDYYEDNSNGTGTEKEHNWGDGVGDNVEWGFRENKATVAAEEGDDYYYYYYDEDNKTENYNYGGKKDPIILNYEHLKVPETTPKTTTQTTTLQPPPPPPPLNSGFEYDERENLIEDDDGDEQEATKKASEKDNHLESSNYGNDDDYDDDFEGLDDDWGEDWNRDQFKIILPPWRDKKAVMTTTLKSETMPFKDDSAESFMSNPYAEDPFLKSREFLHDMGRILKGKDPESSTNGLTPVLQKTVTKTEPKKPWKSSKDHGACFTGIDSFFHYSDEDTMRRMINYKVDINLRFKSRSKHGLLLWSGRHTARVNDHFLSLGIENG